MESKSLISIMMRLVIAISMSLLLAQCSDDQEKKMEEAVDSVEDAKEDLEEETDQQEDDEYSQQEEDGTQEDDEAEDEPEYEEAEDESAEADVLGDMQSGDEVDTEMAEMESDPEPIEAEVDPLASGSEVVEPEATVPVATGPAPESGYRMYFVKADAASTYADASASQAAGSYTRGETLLVSVSGQWGQLQDGRYIKASDLTSSPVGRKKVRGSWQ